MKTSATVSITYFLLVLLVAATSRLAVAVVTSIAAMQFRRLALALRELLGISSSRADSCCSPTRC
jgi:hypothetical protein